MPFLELKRVMQFARLKKHQIKLYQVSNLGHPDQKSNAQPLEPSTMLKLYYFSIFLINLVKILLQRIVGHSTRQVVALLALRPRAPDGGPLLLAVDALQPGPSLQLIPDVGRKEPLQEVQIGSVLIRSKCC